MATNNSIIQKLLQRLCDIGAAGGNSRLVDNGDGTITHTSGDGTVTTFTVGGGGADNLGNHLATQTLSMDRNSITGIRNLESDGSGTVGADGAPFAQVHTLGVDYGFWNVNPIIGGNGDFQFINSSTGARYSLHASGTPTENQDLITKAYFDANNGGGGGSDDQILTLTGTVLSIENGNSVDFAPIMPPGGTDDQQLSLTGNLLTIESGNTVDLSGIGSKSVFTNNATAGTFTHDDGDGTAVTVDYKARIKVDSHVNGLTGAIDNSNTVFTVSAGSYTPGSLLIFVAGNPMSDGFGVTETNPATGTFTLDTAIQTNDPLIAQYGY